jgi:hypothetical protein
MFCMLICVSPTSGALVVLHFSLTGMQLVQTLPHTCFLSPMRMHIQYSISLTEHIIFASHNMHKTLTQMSPLFILTVHRFLQHLGSLWYGSKVWDYFYSLFELWYAWVRVLQRHPAGQPFLWWALQPTHLRKRHCDFELSASPTWLLQGWATLAVWPPLGLIYHHVENNLPQGFSKCFFT